MATYRKRPTVTIEQAWQWLGNRGMGVAKRNIKVRGRWALVRTSYEGDGWDSEVECYDVLSGSIYAEPWSDIKYKDSPFVPYNEERTEIALTKIEQSYDEDEEEDMDEPLPPVWDEKLNKFVSETRGQIFQDSMEHLKRLTFTKREERHDA